jgi:hypothetical protein
MDDDNLKQNDCENCPEPEEKPEVFAVSQEGDSVRYSRRNFLEMAGVAGVAAAGVAITNHGTEDLLFVPTATPSPTLAPTNCFVRTDKVRTIGVYVGPGRNRSIRVYLPANKDIPILGKATDKTGLLWWRIQLPKIEQAWVADEDVTTKGECDAVIDVDAPPIVTAQPRETATPRGPTPAPGVPGNVQPGNNGIEYTTKGVTYTLPCGSPIPAGAVCTCNCVTVPAACSCDSYSPCSCNSFSSHYWYPN